MTLLPPCVMQLLVALRPGGAERLALNILGSGRSRFRGLVAGLMHPPGDLAPMAEAMDLPAFALRAETMPRAVAVWRLQRILRRERVSLLHVQAAYLLPYALPAAFLAGVPLIYTEHATHSLETMPRLRAAVRLAAPFLRGITCVSEPLADFFRKQLGISPRRLTVIPNGVDLDIFSPEGPRAPLPWPEAREKLFVFGNVARLSEAKDQHTLLAAFAEVARRHKQARLLLVGDGESRLELEKTCAALGLADKAHFAGSRTDVAACLRGLDAFVLSSRREGLPMAVLEAMACNLPVIGTDVGDLARLNQERESLRLVPAQSPEHLARAMSELIEHPENAGRLAARGGLTVRQNYDGAAMAARYSRLYQEKGGLK